MSGMRNVLRVVGPYLWRHRRGLWLGLAALALKDVVAAALPLLIRAGIDSITGGFRLRTLLGFCAVLVARSLASFVINFLITTSRRWVCRILSPCTSRLKINFWLRVSVAGSAQPKKLDQAPGGMTTVGSPLWRPSPKTPFRSN